MSASTPLLATFAHDIRAAAPDGNGIAAKLHAALQSVAGMAEVWSYGFCVEMKLVNGEYWAIECLGPNAFRLYPGVVREDHVTWLNLWVRDDYTMDQLVDAVDEVTAAAR
jgi:hypothetical protein